jgi:hypothetical protein
MIYVLHIFWICILVSDWAYLCILRISKVRAVVGDGENERCIALILRVYYSIA